MCPLLWFRVAISLVVTNRMKRTPKIGEIQQKGKQRGKYGESVGGKGSMPGPEKTFSAAAVHYEKTPEYSALCRAFSDDATASRDAAGTHHCRGGCSSH